MAEEKKKAPKAPAAAAEKETVEASGPGANKKMGSRWTMDKVTKIARRFTNEADWKAGHPSSYKSAKDHSWIAECKKHFKTAEKKGNNLKRSA